MCSVESTENITQIDIDTLASVETLSSAREMQLVMQTFLRHFFGDKNAIPDFCRFTASLCLIHFARTSPAGKCALSAARRCVQAIGESRCQDCLTGEILRGGGLVR